MNYKECLEYLRTHCKRGMPGGIERTCRMVELLHHPEASLRVIHVAGTNGKGSTSAILESILRENGYRVGLFTSPHLIRYEERIQINREMISEEAFAQILSFLAEDIIPQLIYDGMEHPGEFELLTVMSWLYFKDRTDYVICEVGLGGALDPTNLVKDPLISVVTPVSLDHCQLLGNTIAEIAGEKAGIIKYGIPVVAAEQSMDAIKVIRGVAEKKSAPIYIANREEGETIETNLLGDYQQVNAKTALTVLRVLKERRAVEIEEEALTRGLKRVSWAGRMEYHDLGEGKGILLDGAHNPDGIRCLSDNLKKLYSGREIIFFLSILDEKEQDLMLETLTPFASRVIITKPSSTGRADHWMDIQKRVEKIAPNLPVTLEEQEEEGLKKAVENLKQDQLLCITGSLYLLGDCEKYLQSILKK